MQIKEFVEKNWRDELQLKTLLGKPGSADLWHFGDVPTEQAKIITNEEGLISEIKTWSGLNWNSRGGYGSPFVHVK